jgi:hypothetical protein
MRIKRESLMPDTPLSYIGVEKTRTGAMQELVVIKVKVMVSL